MGFTTNYWNALKCMFEHSIVSNGLRDYSGDSRNCGWFSDSNAINNIVSNAGLKNGGFALNEYNAAWAVGNGSDAESESDYHLDNVITSGLSGSVLVSGMYTVITLTNISSENITISEVGEFCRIAYAAEQESYGSVVTCLVYRKVLATPLVLAPGDTGAITVSVNFTPPD